VSEAQAAIIVNSIFFICFCNFKICCFSLLDGANIQQNFGKTKKNYRNSINFSCEFGRSGDNYRGVGRLGNDFVLFVDFWLKIFRGFFLVSERKETTFAPTLMIFLA